MYNSKVPLKSTLKNILACVFKFTKSTHHKKNS